MDSSESPVGYLFADIEGSTERWERAPQEMQLAVARLDSLVDQLTARHGGVIHDRAGDGFFVTFRTGNPLLCALEMQLEMQGADWNAVGGLDVRIGVHCGRKPDTDQVDRVAANRAARIMASGWGGQIVVSRDAAEAYAVPAESHLVDLGLCRFKGVKEPLHLLSLVHPKLCRTEFPPLRSLLFQNPVSEPQANPMFGRQREFIEVLTQLRQRRLLTLVGAGGNGKTRLALEVSSEIVGAKTVCFVSLESVGPAELGTVLASALGLRLHPGQAPEAQIVDYLRGKQMLLVLDNADTLSGQAKFVGEIIANCASLSLLVTSREPLGLPDEAVVRIQGFELPVSEASPALRLFVHEARTRDPTFVVDDDQLDVLRAICELVDGSPLALRLTAQWAHLLSLTQILERLRENIGFIESTDLSGERQSLRSVFEGSWRLLTPAQRQALARLSVFERAFDLDAATSVAELDCKTFGVLERKCLIARIQDGQFAMHALVRAFARERLAERTSDLLAARKRHAAYHLDAVRRCMEVTSLPTRGAALERLRQNFIEVRTAWRNAVALGATSMLNEAIEPLCYFLYARSMMREAVELFSLDVKAAALRQHFASIRANFLVHQGDAVGAGVAAASALAAPKVSRAARAHANHALGNLAHMRGDFEQAQARYSRAFQIREQVGDLRGCCYTSVSLGALHLLFSRLESARVHIRRGYQLARQIGDTFGMMVSHLYAGDLAAVEERLDDAQQNYEMSLRLEQSAPHPQFRSMLNRRLGTLSVQRGEPEVALQRHQEALSLSREVGDQRTCAQALIEVGKDLRLTGDLSGAKLNLLGGVRLSMALGMQPTLSKGVLELAQVELAGGDVAATRRLLSVLAGSELGDLRGDYDTLIDRLEGRSETPEAPTTIQALLGELIAEAETDSLKL